MFNKNLINENTLSEIDKIPNGSIMMMENIRFYEGEEKNESLRNWFKKEDWVRINTSGNITGKCGTMKKGKKTQRCLPLAKARSLSKKQRAATSRKKTKSKLYYWLYERWS